MAICSKNVHYSLYEIRTRHWLGLAEKCGVPDGFDQMVSMVLQVPDALEHVGSMLPPGFPARVFQTIRDGMVMQAGRFVDGLP